MAAQLDLHRHLWTLDDYHRMVETGILGKNDRVELVDGELIEMAPIGALHASLVNVLNALLSRQLDGRALISVQNTISLPPDSEPQPDLAVLDWRLFRKALRPGPQDAHLLIEVAHSSLRYDREVKLALYARHGIREVWLVDLEARAVVVHREPSDGEFRSQLEMRQGGRLCLLDFPDVAVAVDDLW